MTDLLTDGTSTYTWDDRSDLTSRTVGSTTLSYGYDARGLRVESSANSGTFYIFDGTTLLGEVSSSGAVQAAYTWGADGLVSERLVPSGRSLWYGYGPQGETRQLTDSTGAVADTYVYSAYGQPISSSGSDANPFRYGGQFGYYTDSALPSGAVLCTYRWYDPNGGRWLSRDPIGYDGGDNLYRYSGDAPTNDADPDGTRKFYIHNPGHMLPPAIISNGYEPSATIPGYNNINYVVDIPNSQNIGANMDMALKWRGKWANIFDGKNLLGPYVKDNTVGDYGKCFAKYPSDKGNPCLAYQRRLGGNFNFGVMAAAMGLYLDDALLAGHYFNFIGKNTLFQLHPQPEQDAIEDGYWYFYIMHPQYQTIDGVTPPPGVVIHQGPPDQDPN